MAGITISGLAKAVGGILRHDRDAVQMPNGTLIDSQAFRQMYAAQAGLQQQQISNQMNNYLTGITTAADSAGYNSGYYKLSDGSIAGGSVAVIASKPKRESATEWLDRRVGEMRVKL